MKTVFFLLFLSVITNAYGGIVPASTTLIKSSSSIAHTPSVVYTQQTAPVVLSYNAPAVYSHAVAPAVYSQQLFAPAQYVSPVLAQGPVFAQQSIFAQYPGLIAQSPVVGHYPFVQSPVISQRPDSILGPSQIPVQGGSPVIAPADNPQTPFPQPPAQIPEQSPIVSGGSPGNTVDDDTVSVESA